MKKITFLASLILIITSCSTNQNQNSISTDFTLKSTDEGFKEDNFGQIIYRYKGSLRNNTQNIYKEVRVDMRVIMNLENGQQLTDESIHDHNGLDFFSSLGSMHLSDIMQPGEEQEMRDFESASIDPKYGAYPIKSVYLQFTAEPKDEVNGTPSDKILIKNDDVTTEWRNIIAQTNSTSK